MLTKLKKEYAFFSTNPPAMRTLLMTNFIFSLVLPVIELFTGAYIIRNSEDFSLVMVFQLAQGTGIPAGFLLNGFFLSRVPVKKLYAAGMMLSSISMASMMLQSAPDFPGVLSAGLVMGLSYGFFWANRTSLALLSTRNDNRNYFYGMETFLYTFSVVLMPFLAGGFIAASREWPWFAINTNRSYYVLTGLVFGLTVLASVLIHRGEFRNPRNAPFLFFSFHRLWRKMLRLSVLKGLAQGYIITAPVMLVMKLVGEEGTLGAIQSSGAILSAGMLYFIGRKSNPDHRILIYGLGLTLFLAGAVTNMILYSASGVIFFVACLVFARPLMDLAYFPIQLGIIEFVAAREKRAEFTYIFTHELGLYSGRLVGCGFFLLLDHFIGENFALRYALVFIALLHFLALWVIRSILRDRAWHEPAEEDLQSVGKLKKPVAV